MNPGNSISSGIVAAVALAFFSAAIANAQQQTSLDLTFNGSIPGQPDGPVAVRLRLYDADTGGTLLFEETQTVNVAGEGFTALIGDVTAGGVPAAVFQSSSSVWIAFALDSNPDVEIGSRTAVTSSGYAHVALSAVGALASVSHDATLSGDGSSGAPLGVAAPLQLTSMAVVGSATIIGNNTNGSGFPGAGVLGSGNTGIGVWGITQGNGSNRAGVYGPASGNNALGVWGEANNGSSANGVYGSSNSGTGVSGVGHFNGVYGTSDSGNGVSGVGPFGVRGSSTDANGTGVYGLVSGGASSVGVIGQSGNGKGVAGVSSSGIGVYGEAGGYAGYFNGRVRVTSIPTGGVYQLCYNPVGDLLQCGSSLRYKSHVLPFEGGLEIVEQLRPISFTWKDWGVNDIGLGAEDVAKVSPSLAVVDDAGQPQGVKYDRLNVVLINAIQQQQRQLEQLQAQNHALNARLQALENQRGGAH